MLRWAAHVQVSLPGGSLTNLFLQANYALIYPSFFCIFIHFMFMTYEILTVPMLHALRCPMYVCMYVCNKDALKNVQKKKERKKKADIRTALHLHMLIVFAFKRRIMCWKCPLKQSGRLSLPLPPVALLSVSENGLQKAAYVPFVSGFDADRFPQRFKRGFKRSTLEKK